MKKLADIIRKIDSRRVRLEEALKSIVEQLKAMGALKIVVFGSFVSGQLSPKSDLDILVIMPDSKKGKNWLKQIYSQIERMVSCDFFVFNKKEYKTLKGQSIFLKEIMKKGQVLYEKKA